MTSLRDLANKLGAMMGEPPLPRLDYIESQVRKLDMRAFTEQERRWIKEAEEQESSDEC